MKKILSLLLVLFLTVGLTGCDLFGDTTPDEIIDCIQNPDGEGCPDISVDDPICEEDEILVNGVCVLIDGRDVEEVFIDTLIENLDGKLAHLEILMDTMDFEDAMEFIAEFNLRVETVEDGVTVEHFVNAIVTDNFQYLETGTLMHRNITVNFDGEIYTIEFLFEEVDTGVIVYVNIAGIKATLAEDNPEVLDVLEALGATEDWLMFRFDDTLANMIELEVMKDMVASIFFLDFGETFFYDLQPEIDAELGVILADYGINIGLFVDYIVDGYYDDAEAMINDIDYETLIFDLDAIHLVPEIVTLLTDNQVELDLAGFPTADKIALIELSGTEVFLESLTDVEISLLLDVLVDANLPEDAPDLSEMYDAYVAGTLDHEIVMWLLSTPDIQMALGDIPGFDLVVFTEAMDLLDYDAFYLEEVDMKLLADAIYEGQTAFDLYLIGLNVTAPETASILAAFSGCVHELEIYKVYVDDVIYALDNLFIFETYIDLQYYLDNEIISINVEKTVDNAIVTTATFDAGNVSQLFVDVLDDAYWYLDGFESFDIPYVQYLNCPVGEVCEDFPEYLEIIDIMDQLGYIEMITTYDPYNPGEMIILFDFTDYVDSIIQSNENPEGAVLEMTLELTVREDGLVTIPTETANVNEIAEDFARFAVNLIGYDYVRDALKYYDDNKDYYIANPLEVPFGDHALDTYGDWMHVSKAFDSNMSFITIGGSVLEPTISLTLYWADGSEVFTGPLSLDQLDSILDDDDMISAAEYLTLLGQVDADNWNLSKMIIIFLFSEFDRDDEHVDDDYYEKEWVYWDAVEVEEAGHIYCSLHTCPDGTQLTWDQLLPYIYDVDTNYYDLYNNGGIVVTVVNQCITVDLERAGTGEWEFPEGGIPSWTWIEEVSIDID